jgi:hypothetical protein
MGKLIIGLQKTETRYNLKWIKELNIRVEILKLVQERAENTLEVIDISNDLKEFSGSATKRKVYKWEYMKLTIFCTTK